MTAAPSKIGFVPEAGHFEQGDDESHEDYLIRVIAGFKNDPLGFVMFTFPWGEGDLYAQDGPDVWQRKFLVDLGVECKLRGFDGFHTVMPILMSVGSGHGIGKSALVAWLILWIMSTRPNCRGTVTASTVTQLQTKTVPELVKWHARAINRHWFRVDTTKIISVDVAADSKLWRCDFHTARKENSEAFAGQHENTSTSFYIFDESSGVPDEIWEVAEGGLTDGEPMWFAFGNRTKAVGRFNDCFKKLAHRWLNVTVDSRQAKMTNKRLIEQWRQDWGEDSDFFRVRVMGLAPGQAADQLISQLDVSKARLREPYAGVDEPLIMGIDVARFGLDRSVIAFRKGNDARTHRAQVYRGIDTMDLADKASAFIRELNVDVCFIDGGGVGGGVVDRLRQLGHGSKIIEVNFGGVSTSKEFYNKRAQMWGLLRDAVKTRLAIEDDDDLEEDLLCQDYLIDSKTRRTRLISKEDLHRLGEHSPDWGDALALTYASPVATKVKAAGGAAGGVRGARARKGWHPHDNLRRGARATGLPLTDWAERIILPVEGSPRGVSECVSRQGESRRFPLRFRIPYRRPRAGDVRIWRRRAGGLSRPRSSARATAAEPSASAS